MSYDCMPTVSCVCGLRTCPLQDRMKESNHLGSKTFIPILPSGVVLQLFNAEHVV